MNMKTATVINAPALTSEASQHDMIGTWCALTVRSFQILVSLIFTSAQGTARPQLTAQGGRKHPPALCLCFCVDQKHYRADQTRFAAGSQGSFLDAIRSQPLAGASWPCQEGACKYTEKDSQDKMLGRRTSQLSAL
jgi:hypothetical protein